MYKDKRLIWLVSWWLESQNSIVLAFGEGPLTTDNVGKWTFAEAHV
jgi:hypothetical protein